MRAEWGVSQSQDLYKTFSISEPFQHAEETYFIWLRLPIGLAAKQIEIEREREGDGTCTKVEIDYLTAAIELSCLRIAIQTITINDDKWPEFNQSWAQMQQQRQQQQSWQLDCSSQWSTVLERRRNLLGYFTMAVGGFSRMSNVNLLRVRVKHAPRSAAETLTFPSAARGNGTHLPWNITSINIRSLPSGQQQAAVVAVAVAAVSVSEESGWHFIYEYQIVNY